MKVEQPGASAFTQLSDVPASYTGAANKVVSVEATETGLEFTTGGPGGGTAWGTITGTLSAQTDLQTALDGKVDENVAITGGTNTKITYDAKGLVTAGAAATTADIDDSTNRRYVTDAQQTVLSNTSGTNTGDNAVNSLYSGLATSKQDTLVSGTNIKTINSTSLLGSGDIAVGGGDVYKVGTPANNQIGVWTGDGTLEGDAALTFDTTTDTLTTGELNVTGGYIVNSGTTPYIDLEETDVAKYGGLFMQSGNLNLYADSPGTIKLNANLDMNFNGFIGSVFTTADNSYNLGSSTYGWANIYLSNNAPINWGNVALLTNKGTSGIRVGSGVANGVVSSFGFYDLVLETGNSVTGNITITQGASGNITLNPEGSGKVVASKDLEVPDEAYGAGWNGSLEVPTKNAVYDKIETLGGSGLTALQVFSAVSIRM